MKEEGWRGGREGVVLIPTREWLEGTACQLMLHNLPLSLFLLSGLGCQKEGGKRKKDLKKKKKKTGGASGWVVEEGLACVLLVWLQATIVCVRACGLLISYSVIRYVVFEILPSAAGARK